MHAFQTKQIFKTHFVSSLIFRSYQFSKFFWAFCKVFESKQHRFPEISRYFDVRTQPLYWYVSVYVNSCQWSQLCEYIYREGKQTKTKRLQRIRAVLVSYIEFAFDKSRHIRKNKIFFNTFSAQEHQNGKSKFKIFSSKFGTKKKSQLFTQ